MHEKVNPDKCDICGEPRQLIKCPCCGGSGFVKNLLIETKCSGCMGSGAALHCPNEHQHLAETRHALLPELKTVKSQLSPIAPVRQEKSDSAALQSVDSWAEKDVEE